MHPPPGAAGTILAFTDELDIPVFLRYSAPLTPPERPWPKVIDAVSAPWPGLPLASPGRYLVRTTWRDVIHAATTVGRNPTGWLAAVPDLAWAEIAARRSPLFAYLGRTTTASRYGAAGPTQYLLKPNVIYHYGAEVSARTVFGYQMGMTMAEWACQGLFRLGPTVHAESVTPTRAGPAWTPTTGLPDLVGYRPGAHIPWLIEAKGGRMLRQPKLREGAVQLTRPGLMAGPHVRVLCGTSLEHRVFVTLDIETVNPRGTGVALPPPGDPSDDHTDGTPDPDTLLDLARSRMLYYLALHALRIRSPETLQITPVGEQVVAPWTSRNAGATLLLENDESTQEARVDARVPSRYQGRPPEQRFDMLTGQIPGTDLILGMSRRLYAACEQLATAETGLAATVDTDPYQPPLIRGTGTGPDEVDERRNPRETLYWERERQQRREFGVRVRAGYERGRESSWENLIQTNPPVRDRAPSGYLEAATSDTYLAVRADTVGRMS